MKLLMCVILAVFWSVTCFAQDSYKDQLKNQILNYKNIYESSLITKEEFLFLVKGKLSVLEMKKLSSDNEEEEFVDDLTHYTTLLEEGTLDIDEFCYLVELSLDLF